MDSASNKNNLNLKTPELSNEHNNYKSIGVNAHQHCPKYKTYMDVFTSNEYRKFKLFYPIPITESIAYNRAKAITAFFQEGCLVKAATMGVGGGVLGFIFGSFIFTMRPMEIDTTTPFRRQLQSAYKGFGKEVAGTVRSFSKIGFIYSLIDCSVVKKRAKQDMLSTLISGCATGAAISWKNGPWAMATGCFGFGAFSAIIEKLSGGFSI